MISSQNETLEILGSDDQLPTGLGPTAPSPSTVSLDIEPRPHVQSGFPDDFTMKTNFVIFSCIFVVGCTSTIVRSPSAIDKNKFSFNLYGSKPAPNGIYIFHLLDLEKLRNQKIEFQKFNLAEANAEISVTDWQKHFRHFREDYKEGLRFEYKKALVDVDSSDLTNLEKSLEALDQSEPRSEVQLKKKIELISSFNERFKNSIETKIQILTAPLLALSYLGNYSVPVGDGPSIEVPTTSFWQKRSNSQNQMLKGHGQFDVSRLDREICKYNGPKKGYGVHAGFKIKCGESKLKIKFGNETYSAPLNSRLYHRLGYNVPAIHHLKTLKINYDRRLFTEFNSRKTNLLRVKLLQKEVAALSRPKIFDVRSFVSSAELKNGQLLSSEEMFQKLLVSCSTSPCDYSESNINRSFESEIATLNFIPSAAVEEIGEEIGPWSYSELDHSDRTEVKGLLLVGAWTGNYDLRKDNTRLVWLKETGEMKHFISDPGSGLGNQGNPFMRKEDSPKIEDMKWTTTIESRLMNGEEQMEIVAMDFRTLMHHDVFRKLSFQEAQWMARQIAGVSEDEISEAIIGSGFSTAEFLLLREKLVSIQQEFIKHFKLSHEFKSQIRPINKKISFSSAEEFTLVKLKNGKEFKLENRGVQLVNGSLVHPQPANP